MEPSLKNENEKSVTRRSDKLQNQLEMQSGSGALHLQGTYNIQNPTG